MISVKTHPHKQVKCLGLCHFNYVYREAARTNWPFGKQSAWSTIYRVSWEEENGFLELQNKIKTQLRFALSVTGSSLRTTRQLTLTPFLQPSWPCFRCVTTENKQGQYTVGGTAVQHSVLMAARFWVESGSSLSLKSFHVLPVPAWVFSSFLSQSKNMSKTVWVCPVMDCWPIQGVFLPLSQGLLQ